MLNSLGTIFGVVSQDRSSLIYIEIGVCIIRCHYAAFERVYLFTMPYSHLSPEIKTVFVSCYLGSLFYPTMLILSANHSLVSSTLLVIVLVAIKVVIM